MEESKTDYASEMKQPRWTLLKTVCLARQIPLSIEDEQWPRPKECEKCIHGILTQGESGRLYQALKAACRGDELEWRPSESEKPGYPHRLRSVKPFDALSRIAEWGYEIPPGLRDAWEQEKQRREIGKQTKHQAEVVSGESNPNPGKDWKVHAREIADECFERDTKNNCRDSLANYSNRVKEEMQRRDIKGPRGLITNPSTVQREALQGDLWWAKKPK